jgi:hypothetical protein
MANFMNDTNLPTPSVKSLVFASGLAILLATILLITSVLPAEYGIDPTGLGKRLGLTQLSSSGEDIVDPMIASCKEQLGQWTDSTTIVVPVHSGLEYKFDLLKEAKLEYAWKTDGAKIYFDLHGEPHGDKTGFFKSFKVGSENQFNGSITTEFAGPHGWYFENKTQAPVTIILNTKGTYQVLGLM